MASCFTSASAGSGPAHRNDDALPPGIAVERQQNAITDLHIRDVGTSLVRGEAGTSGMTSSSGSALPFIMTSNRRSRRQRARCRLGRVGRVVTKHTCQQPVEFLGDRSGEPAVAPLLPRICNSERKNISSQRSRCLAGKFPLPEYAQFSSAALTGDTRVGQ
jgi:hypothetical protein